MGSLYPFRPTRRSLRAPPSTVRSPPTYWQRVFSQQRTQIETSKLVATVALALAGTLVGTTMQVQPHGRLDVAACALVGVGLLGVVLLLLYDSLPEPDVDDIALRYGSDGDA